MTGVLLSLLTAQSAQASSVIEEHLATVTEVRIVVESGGMSYDPIEGYDRQSFDQLAAREVSDALDKCTIASADSSPQKLVLRISHTKRRGSDALVIMKLRLELREPATLARVWNEGQEPRSLEVISWRESNMVIARPDEALGDLVEMVGILALDFAQAVAGARWKSQGLGWPARVGCLADDLE